MFGKLIQRLAEKLNREANEAPTNQYLVSLHREAKTKQLGIDNILR